jgi:hypothetical protein
MRHDFLHDFLHALDTYQQKACRAYLLSAGTKWQAQHVKIFDMLIEMDRYDPEALSRAFGKSEFKKVLSVERHRLTRLIVDGALNHRRRTEGPVDPWRIIDEARLLMELGLAQDAADSLRVGIVIAEKVQDIHLELALRELLRTAFRSLPREGLIGQITENDYRLESTALKVVNLLRYTSICDSLNDYQKKFRIADDISVR